MFVDLGGTNFDLTFKINDMEQFPLMIACAKGDLKFVKLILINPSVDINQRDA